MRRAERRLTDGPHARHLDSKHGKPEVLEVRESEDPKPGPGEVRIRVEAAGLNFAETSARQGIYPAAPKPPCVVGYEGAGVVDALGEGTEGPAIGSRVVFLRRFGAHSDTVCVPRHQLAPIPDAMSFEHAAALPVNYLTAYQMISVIRRVAPGDKVLVHAAAGGVGTAVLQMCRAIGGVTTFGTASARKHDYVRTQGCDHPIDYHTVDYVQAVREQTGGDGVDLVCDALGGADWKKGYSLLRPGGILICFGLANAQRAGKASWPRVIGQVLRIPRFNPLKMMGENRGVAGVDLGAMWPHHQLIQDGLARLVAMYEAGDIRPHIDATYPFERAAEAHAHLEEGRNMGKIILVP